MSPRGGLASLGRALAGPSATSAPRPADVLWPLGLALAVRGLLVAYAASRFPPVDDGTFYHVVADRIARGLGYTWAWPDGAVTIAAHYPVGYPALVGAFYALFGSRPGAAMLLNVLVGTLSAGAAHTLAARVASRAGALLAGVLVALEPALVLYTPALMTEAVAGELLLVAAAIAVARRPGSATLRAVAAGVVLGVALLVRPQLVLVAPLFGWLVAGRASLRRRLSLALIVVGASVGCCLPWTARNCARLDRCAFVSANGGWNLYIGSSPLGKGGFAPIDAIGVPQACRTVFGEGAKDRCFGRAGLERIVAHPGAWLSLVPDKLGMTFDYGTAAAHYLAASNGALVGEREKTAIGAAELVGQRVLLLLGLLALARADGPRARARRVLGGISALAAFQPAAYLAWLGLVATALTLGRAIERHGPALLVTGVVAATALTHAMFFGASRYALVCVPALGALSGCVWLRRPGEVSTKRDESSQENAKGG